jgi:hypothetical protein
MILFDAPPRVQFNIGVNEEIQFNAGSPPQLIVDESSTCVHMTAATTTHANPKTTNNYFI